MQPALSNKDGRRIIRDMTLKILGHGNKQDVYRAETRNGNGVQFLCREKLKVGDEKIFDVVEMNFGLRKIYKDVNFDSRT